MDRARPWLLLLAAAACADAPSSDADPADGRPSDAARDPQPSDPAEASDPAATDPTDAASDPIDAIDLVGTSDAATDLAEVSDPGTATDGAETDPPDTAAGDEPPARDSASGTPTDIGGLPDTGALPISDPSDATPPASDSAAPTTLPTDSASDLGDTWHTPTDFWDTAGAHTGGWDTSHAGVADTFLGTPDAAPAAGDGCPPGVIAWVDGAPYTDLAAAVHDAAGAPVDVCDGTWSTSLVIPSGTTAWLRALDGDPEATRLLAASERVIVAMAGSTLILEDLGFTGGRTAGDGGAILAQDVALLKVLGCVFTDNRADNGGAIAGWANNPAEPVPMLIYDTRFADNRAAHHGGAVHLGTRAMGLAAELVGDTFTDNVADGEGGAIRITSDGGTIWLYDADLSGNRSGYAAGGLSVESWMLPLNVVIDRGRFFGNSTGHRGGAIDAAFGPIHLSATELTVQQNHADEHGGGLFYRTWDPGSVVFQRSDFLDNTAADGAAFAFDSEGGPFVRTPIARFVDGHIENNIADQAASAAIWGDDAWKLQFTTVDFVDNLPADVEGCSDRGSAASFVWTLAVGCW